MNINWARLKSKAKKRKKLSTKKRWSYFYEDDIAGFAMKKEKDIIMGVSSFDEYVQGSINQRRFEKGLKTKHSKLKIFASKRDWNEFLHTELGDKLRVIQTKDYSGWAVDDDLDSYIDYYISGSTANIDIVGGTDFVDSYREIVLQKFDQVESYIKWIYDGEGNNITLPLNEDMLPISSMYPFLEGESLESYYDRFMKSTASILLLIGPPGTGKTTFIRGLLDHAKTSAIVTYDPGILSKDNIFADFLEDEDSSIMVLEDSDSFLSSRNAGNDLMHKFLNVGDGLVTVKGKKMVFSTNLPSVRDVDPALLRPGRCFHVAKFGSLNPEQAHTFASEMGITITQEKNSYTVAEIFHEMNIKTVSNFGFNQ